MAFRSQTMPSPADALPGRAERMPVPETHFVNGHRLTPPFPDGFRPTWLILLVPPSLIYANGVALYSQLVFLEPLYFFALALAAALLVVSRGFARWPFGPPWWAFTFPLDALAYAATRYAQDHPAPLWRALCAATLLLATFSVALVLVRTLRSAASRRG